MLLPIRSKNPPESIPVVTCVLILLNTAIFFCTSDGLTVREGVVDQFAAKSSNLSPLTVMSSMFLHGSLMHLVGNMWFLYLFGFAVEGRLKSLKFSVLYLGSGVLATLTHNLTEGRLSPDVPLIGASGAIMGVLGAALYLFPFAKIQFVYTWWTMLSAGFIDIPMWGVSLMYFGLDIVFAMLSRHGVKDGTAHFAHIGGVAAGVAICALFLPRRDTATASDAKAILSETKDLGALSRVELAELYKSNPADTTVLLNWMHTSLMENRLNDECANSFLAALPRIILEQPPLAVASSVSMLSATTDRVTPGVLVELAARVEQTGNPSTALQLYDQALRDQRISQNDEACALFRSALIYETRVGNPANAQAWFEELIRRQPMSSWADQAKARLSTLRVQP